MIGKLTTKGKPFYTYDLNKIEKAYTSLKKLPLINSSKIYYSIKSNNNSGVVDFINTLGGNFEVSSEGELDIVLAKSISSDKILVSGPYKSIGFYKRCLINNIKMFSVESIVDLKKLEQVCVDLNQNCNVLLRINPINSSLQPGLRMTGVASQFGIDEILMDKKLLIEMNKIDRVNIIGIHVFNGSNNFELNHLVENFNSILKLFIKTEKFLKRKLSTINFGGGFPSEYSNNKDPIDLKYIENELHNICNSNKWLSEKEILFESGRFITGASGTIFGQVVDIKKNKGKEFAILNFGMNALGGMNGIGRLYSPTAEINILTGNMIPSKKTTHFVGPSCSPLDVIGVKKNHTKLINIGDWISINNVGAYGLSSSLINFISQDIPIEYCIHDNQVVHKNLTKIIKEEVFI
ncbi:diaminopimelate decarboxylase [Enterococcus rotai]|uniref:Decarboxylase n=1 Tax=Enterococcus rotai TaxID=118060 RepID=A0A0U2WLC3_9ENTE|nr:hypothetical protein [Enterococcus rotai]ALS36070.1 hypothetical protein ATZ35_02505 [Enterococcus rotai]